MIQVLTFHILGFGHRYGSVSKDVKKEGRFRQRTGIVYDADAGVGDIT